MKYLALPLFALSACSMVSTRSATAVTAAPPPLEAKSPPFKLVPVQATEVRDQAALERLRGNSGLTLQWIGWVQRGTLAVSQRGAVVHLKGVQLAPGGKGLLSLDGSVVRIDSNHFIFRGRIEITDTPDAGRKCVKEGDSEFAITQGRKYWRMSEFEWCDDLTDYIDIYF